MKKTVLISLILILGLACGISLLVFAHTGEGGGVAPQAATFLVLGIDEAAANTDVILLLHYESATATLSVAQIPRDTYLENETGVPKVNHLYAARRAAGDGHADALSYTAKVLSSALGLSFDGAISLDFSALSALVDDMGGLPITLTADFTYDMPDGTPAVLPAGEHCLSGAQALGFVRHRADYLEGDIGRIDAQKLFLSAFLHRATEALSPTRLLSYLSSPPAGMTVALYSEGASALAAQLYLSRHSLSAVYFSLPGEAAQAANGVWYYYLNREATASVLTAYLGLAGRGGFDAAHRFCGQGITAENLYYATDFQTKIYTDRELSDITIQKKEPL